MLDALQRVVARLMNQVRVNRIQRCMRDGVPVFVKQRRTGGQMVIWFANRFLSLAHSGICMFVHANEWTDWEVHCARLLYPDRRVVKADSGQTVIISTVPGTTLRDLLHGEGRNVSKAFILAARELRRVHQIHCSYHKAAWSHGDLHLDNILYESNTQRAVLIDFDTRHEFRVSQTQRHADDLKIVLLELIAMTDDRWIQPATAFIQEYRDVSVLTELDRQLVVPRGVAGLLWYARTNCCPVNRIEPRLRILREIIRRVTTTACSRGL